MSDVAVKSGTEKLTPLEWRFMCNVIREGMTLADAYISILADEDKDIVRRTAYNQGSIYMKKIKAKIDWDEMLAIHNLDDSRLAYEVGLRLEAETTKFYQDEELGEYADNGVRMQATKLLAELRGKTNSGININTTTNVQVNVQLSPEDEVRFEANIASMFDD